MPEHEYQLFANLRRTGRGPDGRGWELTLIAPNTNSTSALGELTDLQMGDDHSKTLFLVKSGQGNGRVVFDVFTGPDVSASEDHLSQLYRYRAPDDQIPVQAPAQDQAPRE